MNEPTRNMQLSTPISPVQIALALLALAPLVCGMFDINPGVGLWLKGAFRPAVIEALLYPGVYALVLGMAFPVVSTLRGEMSRRNVIASAWCFGVLALVLLVLLGLSLPGLLTDHPHPSSTRWISAVRILALPGTFIGYSTGFTLGALLILPKAKR